jgi:hypothetical protein
MIESGAGPPPPAYFIFSRSSFTMTLASRESAASDAAAKADLTAVFESVVERGDE